MGRQKTAGSDMTSTAGSRPRGLAGRILSFGLVGVAGFFVDAAVLALLIGWLGPYGARAASFAAAVLTTWALNRSTTFRDRAGGLPLATELGRYVLAMCLGGAVNYGVYAALIGAFGAGGVVPYAALGAGSLAGMGVNLLAANYAVFRPPAAPPAQHPPGVPPQRRA